MAGFAKAADRDVLERVIYLTKSKGTVYALLGKVSEQSGFLFVYDSKVVDNDRTVKLGAGQRTIRQAVYEIIGRQDISLRVVENHILINQSQVQYAVVPTSKDTLAYFTLEGKLQDNQSGAPIAYGTVALLRIRHSSCMTPRSLSISAGSRDRKSTRLNSSHPK